MLRRLSMYTLGAYITLVAYNTIRFYINLPFQAVLTPVLTGLAFLFALLHASERLTWRRALVLLGLCFGISLLFESVGVATGIFYGPYHYTNQLGPKFLNLVPYQIALAWFMMMYPAYVLAEWVLSGSPRRGWPRDLTIAAIGGIIMTAWDLAMDPVMVAGGHWIWDVKGAYFGIPLHNFFGWWLTTFIIFLLFRRWVTRTDPGQPTDPIFDRLAWVSYLVTGLSTVLVGFSSQLGGPALVGLFAMGPWLIIAWQKMHWPLQSHSAVEHR